MLVVMALLGAYYGYLYTNVGMPPLAGWVLIIVLFIVGSFSTLNVTIDETDLKIKFGYGLYKKKFELNQIVSAKSVKNHWYYGWGLRYWPRNNTWIFNVSGFDAVEFVMKDGKTFRIGTDEPEELESALNQAIKIGLHNEKAPTE